MKKTKSSYPKEHHFQKHVKKKLREIDGCWHFTKEALSIRGLPDIIGVCNGRFFAWELKRSPQEASKNTGRIVLQKHVLHKIQMVGGIGRLVHPDNLEQCLEELRDIPHC